MIDLGPASLDEVILAFVEAELDASRFRNSYEAQLRQLGKDRAKLIDAADLANEHDNQLRRELLRRCRGFPNSSLFQGFPTDVSWRRASISTDEFGALAYANHPNWMKLSGGTGLVIDGAKNLPDSDDLKLTTRIRAVADRIDQGQTFPELIVVVDPDRESLILLEGTTRATAYALVAQKHDVPIFIGASDDIRRWAFFPTEVGR